MLIRNIHTHSREIDKKKYPDKWVSFAVNKKPKIDGGIH